LVVRVLGPKHRIDVRRTGSGWHEMRITGANAPAGWTTLGQVVRGDAHSMSLDVTDLVARSGSTRVTAAAHRRADAPRSRAARRGTGRRSRSTAMYPEPVADADRGPDAVRRSSATPTPHRPGGGDVQPSLPIRAAFYYPWFPETWGPSA
jgi:hypothetical protein